MTDITIRAGREALGLTQQALAAMLGVDTCSVSRWERGAQTVPRMAVVAVDALVRLKAAEDAPERRGPRGGPTEHRR